MMKITISCSLTLDSFSDHLIDKLDKSQNIDHLTKKKNNFPLSNIISWF